MKLEIEVGKADAEVLCKMAKTEMVTPEELMQKLLTRWCNSFRFKEQLMDIRLKGDDKQLLLSIAKDFQTDHNLFAQRILEMWIDEQRTGQRTLEYKPGLGDKIKAKLKRKAK